MRILEGKFGKNFLVLFLTLILVINANFSFVSAVSSASTTTVTVLVLTKSSCADCALIDGYGTALSIEFKEKLESAKLAKNVEVFSLYLDETTGIARASTVTGLADGHTYRDFDGIQKYNEINQKAQKLFKEKSAKSVAYPLWVIYYSNKDITSQDKAFVASGITKKTDGTADFSAIASSITSMISKYTGISSKKTDTQELGTSPNLTNSDQTSESVANSKSPNGADLDSANGNVPSGIFAAISVPEGELKIGSPNPINIKFNVKSKKEKFKRIDLFISDMINGDNPKWFMKCSTGAQNSLCGFKGSDTEGEGTFKWNTIDAKTKPGAHKIRLILWNDLELPKINPGNNAEIANLAQKALAYYDYPVVISGENVLTNVKAVKDEDGSIETIADASEKVDSVTFTIDDNEKSERTKIETKKDKDGKVKATTKKKSSTQTSSDKATDKTTTDTATTPTALPEAEKKTNILDKILGIFGYSGNFVALAEDAKPANAKTDSDKTTIKVEDGKTVELATDNKTNITITTKDKDGKLLSSGVLKPYLAKAESLTASITSGDPIGFGFMLQSLKDLVNHDSDNPDEVITNRILAFINFLFALGSALMILFTLWSGVTYIFSMGNEEVAGKAKKNFINILIGLVVMLGSLTIINIIRTVITTSQIG